jgi:hypothetical protein
MTRTPAAKAMIRCSPIQMVLTVRQAAQLLRVRAKALWRRIEHYGYEARAKQDMSGVRLIGIDETSLKRGHAYLTVVHDLDAERLLFATPGRDHPAERRALLWGMRRNPSSWSAQQVNAMHWLQRAHLKSARAWRLKMGLRCSGAGDGAWSAPAMRVGPTQKGIEPAKPWPVALHPGTANSSERLIFAI